MVVVVVVGVVVVVVLVVVVVAVVEVVVVEVNAPVRELSIGQLDGNKQPATGGCKCFVLAAEDTQGRDIPEKHQPHLY